MQIFHPQAEILYLGDFNVHHTEWLSSSHTDRGGVEALDFSILHGLDQLFQQPTHIPDRHDQAPNTLEVGGGRGCGFVVFLLSSIIFRSFYFSIFRR